MFLNVKGVIKELVINLLKFLTKIQSDSECWAVPTSHREPNQQSFVSFWLGAPHTNLFVCVTGSLHVFHTTASSTPCLAHLSMSFSSPLAGGMHNFFHVSWDYMHLKAISHEDIVFWLECKSSCTL